MEQDKFIINSIKERLALGMIINNQDDLQLDYFTPSRGKDRYDGVIISGGTKLLVEVKVRKNSIKSYATTIIEEKKYNWLKDEKNNSGMTAIYLVVFTDGYIILHVNEYIPTFKLEWFNETEGSEPIEKSVSHILIEGKEHFIDMRYEELIKKSEELFVKYKIN